MINKIVTVLKYISMDFKEQDGNIIKTYRKIPGEVVEEPLVEPLVEEYAEYYNKYSFPRRWLLPSGTQAVTFSSENDISYTLERYEVVVKKEAQVKLNGNLEGNQTMYTEFVISAANRVYLKNFLYLGYLIFPTVVETRTGIDGTLSVIDFKVSPMTDLGNGTITLLSPKLDIYLDAGLTQKIGSADITIKIMHSSSGSTGD
ncbi:hypothetical protein LJC17_04930 [Acholeplasma sp. OttesenSCG-928-E16]|nr:hypothetical protein [Acholeplasma sp. OttesenSCG-928-E16]